MTTGILNQLQSFENFIEAVENIEEKIFKDGANLAACDLRDAFGNIHPMPMCLEDYTKIWFGTIKERYELFYKTKLAADEYFLDVYLNDVDANRAYFQDEVVWLRFHKNGIEVNPTTPIEYYD